MAVVERAGRRNEAAEEDGKEEEAACPDTYRKLPGWRRDVHIATTVEE